MKYKVVELWEMTLSHIIEDELDFDDAELLAKQYNILSKDDPSIIYIVKEM